MERAYRVCSTGTTTDTGACGDVCRPVECSLGGGNYGSCNECENALVDNCCWAVFEACKAETGVCTSDSSGWDALQLCFLGDSETNPGACRIACGL